MSETVIASIDTGADLGATATDTGASGEGGTGTGEAAVSTAAGAGAEGQRAADQGSTAAAAAGTGADDKSAPGGDAQGDGKDKLVPLAALHESREQLRALRAKIEQLEAVPRLTPEQQKLLEKLNAKEEAATVPKDPDFLEDPKGYVDTKLTQTQKALKELNDANKTRTDQERAQQETTQTLSTVGAKEQEFLKSTPDYYDAVTHIRSVRASQLQMLYPGATAEQISRQIGIEEIGAARHVMQSGGDPADFAYRYAKTVGYVPKAPAAAGASGSAAAKDTKVDKDAVRSMGGGGGGASTDDGDDENAMPEFSSALAERFGVKGKKK